ncbi:MAG TPA: hypothetical protein VF834_20820 [Streptosporangiaceae bacterium]
MRHVIGFVLSLALSAALFFGAGWGIAGITSMRSGQGLRTIGALTNPHNALPIAAVIGTGLALGILLAVRRVSPIATGLPGLVLLAWSGLLVMRGSHALSYVPLSGTRYAAGFTTLLNSGALALLGVVMILPLFLVPRWRRRLVEVEDLDESEDEDFSVQAALGLAP